MCLERGNHLSVPHIGVAKPPFVTYACAGRGLLIPDGSTFYNDETCIKKVLCAGGQLDILFDGSFCRITHSAVLSEFWGKQAERLAADRCN